MASPVEEVQVPDSPVSPAARRLATPRWLDTRLVLGVLLVLLSVLVGARVLAGADRSQLVWATSRALAPGSVLASEDLVAVRVRLFDTAGLYLDADQPAPVGYVAARGLGAGELLPDDALRRPELEVDYRLVTVLVELGHVPPDLVDGQQVDVWLTPDREPGAAAPAATPRPSPLAAPVDPASAAPPTAGVLQLSGSEVVLPGVTVAAGPAEDGSLSGGSAVPVVLQVRPSDVARLLSATSLGRLDLVRVPRAAESGAPVEPVGPGDPATSGGG